MPGAVKEEDIISNQVNIDVSKSLSKVASWLAPYKESTLNSHLSSEDEDDTFTPSSETTGIGNTLATIQKPIEEDKLKKRLGIKQNSKSNIVSRVYPQRNREEEIDDESEGRSALFSKETQLLENSQAIEDALETNTGKRKKTNNFMDEILAERNRKKQRKLNKKQKVEIP
ncbi:MAG: hypothetical protein M1834_003946 [Cirrosporium novae-zelandiae]|nr:MAG: hypothetical protein M1834_003946 [Cirrosporium novae-zelandiae]